jgi:hypothetical protein
VQSTARKPSKNREKCEESVTPTGLEQTAISLENRVFFGVDGEGGPKSGPDACSGGNWGSVATRCAERDLRSLTLAEWWDTILAPALDACPDETIAARIRAAAVG